MSDGVTAYIGVGSNVGDRADFCRRALRALAERDGVELEAVSSLYETSPVGGPPQRSYVNAVARIRTTLQPTALLAACKAIERSLGREPEGLRWGPRVADLDILIYDDAKVSEPGLEIPHPRLTERRFVLVPLLEIDPDAADPQGSPYAGYVAGSVGEVRLLEPF